MKLWQSLKTRCSETQQGVNVCVQDVINAVEVEKRINQEKINQVTRHVETLLLQIVEKTFEIPELQFSDKVDIPVVTQRQIRMNPDVQKTMEIPQLQHADKVVDVPVVLVVLRWCRSWRRQFRSHSCRSLRKSL